MCGLRADLNSQEDTHLKGGRRTEMIDRMVSYKPLIRYFACLVAALTILYLLPATCWPVSVTIQANSPVNSRRVDSEILVRFKSGVSQAEARAILSRHRMKIARKYSFVGNLFHVRLRSGLAVETAIEELKAEPSIDYAEPNYIVEFNSACPAPCIPNDPFICQSVGTCQYPGRGGLGYNSGIS